MSEVIISARDAQKISQISSQLPHALLVIADYGLDGLGVAQILAKNNDTFHLKPLPEKQTISIDQIRELISMLRTYAINRRVIVINEADSMTEPSQNAFLKALEEPNKNTNFILVAKNPKLMLDTVRSRCQTLTLHKTTSAQDKKLLEKYNLDPASSQQILFLAAGRPLLIKELAENPEKFAEYRQLATDAKQILATNRGYDTFKNLVKYFSDRQKAILLTDIIVNMIRFQSLSRGINPSLEDQLEKTTSVASALKSNANVRLALAQLVI